jgi:hypothetical protein
MCALLCLGGCEDAGVQPVFDTPMFFRGYAYTSFAADGFAQGSARSAVADLRAQTGSTWIALTVVEFQSTLHSSDIAPNTTGINPLTGTPWYATSTHDDIRTAVLDARSSGMHIMLKPHVDCYSGAWRGLIAPDEVDAWFSAYSAMMLKYARMAQEEHVEMLCIGTELPTLTAPQYADRWKALIARVRLVYNGMLTYSSNWSGVSGPAEYDQITFWSALDYIGVSAYFPLTHSPLEAPPPEAAAEASLHAHGMRLSALAVRVGKQIILTEIGCQSAQGALSNPADYSLGASPGAVSDQAAQALYYASVINYFGSRPWCAGMFFWNWETAEGAHAPTDYTCRNKQAAIVLKRFYLDQPPALLAGNE